MSTELAPAGPRMPALLLAAFGSAGLGVVAVYLTTIANVEQLLPSLLAASAGFGLMCLMFAARIASRRDGSPFHPIIYAMWMFFVPSFVIGGAYVSLADFRPPWLLFLSDPATDLPLTVIYAALGVAALYFGFVLKPGARAGTWLSERLPSWQWSPGRTVAGAAALLCLGEMFRVLAFSVGATGYQVTSDPNAFGFTFVAFSWIASIASFVMWYAVFRWSSALRLIGVVVLGLVTYELAFAFISGHRSSLMVAGVRVFAAFWLAGRRLNVRGGIIAGVLMIFLVFGGYIVGTTYRGLKGSEAQISYEENLDLGKETFGAISAGGQTDVVRSTVFALMQRFESVTMLAVVVSNYEKLKPLEEQYGIANNIFTDTVTSFIPRFLWADKPLISNSRAYSALYFAYPTNSFSITPIGDLLRNYGPVGVPLGMAILGVGLRMLWTTFGSGRPRSAWEAAAYYFLLTRFGYESFFGSILPGLIRMSIVLLVFGVLLNWFAGTRRQPAAHAVPR